MKGYGEEGDLVSGFCNFKGITWIYTCVTWSANFLTAPGLHFLLTFVDGLPDFAELLRSRYLHERRAVCCDVNALTAVSRCKVYDIGCDESRRCCRNSQPCLGKYTKAES